MGSATPTEPDPKSSVAIVFQRNDPGYPIGILHGLKAKGIIKHLLLDFAGQR